MSKSLNISKDTAKDYKLTTVGLIPMDWQVKKLGEILRIRHGRDQKSVIDADGIYPILGTGGIIGYTNKFLYNKPSVLIGRKGSIDKPQYMETPFWTVDTLFYTEVSAEIIPLWLFFRFQKINWYLYNEATGVPSLSASTISSIKILIPPKKEQKKIAEILSTCDEAISTQCKLLKESLRRKKGLEQQLLSGKLRFGEFVKGASSHKTPVGELPEDWELKHISDIVQRVKKPFTPEPETLYREIGIRSHCKGIFHKEEVTGASLGNKSVFWIQPDCFVVNIVFAWEHAIAKTTEAEVGMIASHRFPMYKPKKGILDLDYLLYYFKTARGKHLLGLASPGGAGRNKTLGQSEFSKLKIPVPSLEEQKKIVAVLSQADKEIELLQQQIDTLKEQKKGLMQKLLTGEIRTI